MTSYIYPIIFINPFSALLSHMIRCHTTFHYAMLLVAAVAILLIAGCGVPRIQSPPLLCNATAEKSKRFSCSPLYALNYSSWQYRIVYEDGSESNTESGNYFSQDLQFEFFKPFSLGVVIPIDLVVLATAPFFYAKYAYPVAPQRTIFFYGGGSGNFTFLSRDQPPASMFGIVYAYNQGKKWGFSTGAEFSNSFEYPYNCHSDPDAHISVAALGSSDPDKRYYIWSRELRVPLTLSFRGYFLNVTGSFLLSECSVPDKGNYRTIWQHPNPSVGMTHANSFQWYFSFGFDMKSMSTR